MPHLPDDDAPLELPLDPFASRARTRELVEQLPVVVFVDTDELRGTTVYISPNVEKVLGHPQASVLEDHEGWYRSIHPEDRDEFWRSWEDAWKRGTPFHAEYRLLRPDGEEIWIRESSVLVLSESGRRLAWQGVVEDLTAEKRSQEEVRESESRYRALVERVPAVVYEMDPDDERRTLYVSPHVEQVLGYSRAEWLDQPDIWIELLHSDDREVVLEQHDRHSETGEPWDLEYRLIANDGRVVWVHDRAILIRGRDRGTPAWHGVMIDITVEHDAKEMLLLHQEELERRVDERTNELQEANELMGLEIGERRRMEDELRQVEDRYRRLVENMPGIAYIWDVRPGAEVRSFGYVSPRLQDVLGFSTDDWHASTRIHPHDQARVAEALSRSARTGESFLMEYRFLAKDGSVVWVLDHASLIARTADGDPLSFQGVLLDITARKDAESKAEQAEDRFRALTEGGPMVAYAYDLAYGDGGWPPSVELTYMSPQVADIIGYPVEMMSNVANWRAMIHPDDRERALGDFERTWRTGEDWNVLYRMMRGDGAVIWLHSLGRMSARDASGRPWRFQGVMFDLTQEQESRAELARAEESQRNALEGALVIPWSETIDPDTGFERYTYIGPQAFEIMGYTPEELMVERKHFPRMVHPDDRARVRKTVARSGEAGIWEDTYRILRRDGGTRWIHSFGRRVSPPGVIPEVWHGIAVDVTATHAEPEAPSETRPEGQEADRNERSSVEDPAR